MGLKNFTTGDDDTGSNNNSNGGGLFGGLPGMGGPTGVGSVDDDAVKEMLIDYNERFVNSDAVLFRDLLIEQTLAILIGKHKRNALLVGSAGVGKTKIVEDIARRIALGDTLIPDKLKDHTIYELPISNIVAGSGVVGEIEAKVKAIVEFAADPKNKAILFMDEIHLLVDSHNPTYSKIAQILKPALARGDMRVIGATTSQESRDLDADPAFNRRFSKLIVDELTQSQTVAVLSKIRPGLIAHYQHQITVSDDVLEQVITIADQNSRAGAHRPDNAITLLDRAMANRVLEQKRLITQATIDGNTALVQALQAVPKFPLTEARVLTVAKQLLTGNAERHQFDVAELEDSLKATIQGQDNVLDTIVDSLAREELNLFPRSTPIAWMFAGASGVGKTETAKIIAQHVTAQDPIIVNMTEYHAQWSTAKILGAPAGYIGSDSNQELPFDTLESNPHRVILLDEFEKADPAVQRLFLAALDEGSIKTARGKAIDFSKAIIIATTNAAREALSTNHLGFGSASAPRKISTQSLNKMLMQHFDAELLGRFSLLVGFNPIDEQVYRHIIAAEYERQRERIVAQNQRHGTALPAGLPGDEVRALAGATYVPDQGARPAHKVVRTWIEDRLIAIRQTNFAAQSGATAVAADADDTTDDKGATP
jgi:ATP-dependent Clp protease ATP-binding subunit ClpA